MRSPQHPRPTAHHFFRWTAASALLIFLATEACAQSPAAVTPASPATTAVTANAAPLPSPVSTKKARTADDAYIAGARELAENNIPAAVRDFTHALELDPGRTEYAVSLAVAREHQLSDLVQQAAKARLLGHTDEASRLIAAAKAIDPDNRILTEHLDDMQLVDQPTSTPNATGRTDKNAPAFFSNGGVPILAGPIELQPTSGVHDFHHQGDCQDLLRVIYLAFGIKAVFDTSVTPKSFKFDLEGGDFQAASHLALSMCGTFAVAIDEKTALVAKDNAENKDRLVPLIEETLSIPGVSSDQMTDLGALVRTIFSPQQISLQLANGRIILRGEESNIKAINATLADLLDGGADVLLELHMYEIDKTHIQDIGAATPGSAGIFSIAAEAQSLVAANQALLQQAISAGYLTLSGSPLNQLLQELGFLVATGTVSAGQFGNILGTVGHGLTFAGVYLGGSSTFNLLLNSSDVRSLDELQLRLGDKQPGSFRSGTRYPVVTATYSSGISSSLASQLAGAAMGNSTVASLLQQYLGTGSSVSTPQFQYEDLGLTLKVLPVVQRSGGVQMHLDLKIEALAGASLNSIPILNNRAIVSDLTIPDGQTAMLATVVSNSELRSIQGIPGLSELPGFQGTDKRVEKDTGELLITLTPHVIRRGSMEYTSRRIPFAKPLGEQ